MSTPTVREQCFNILHKRAIDLKAREIEDVRVIERTIYRYPSELSQSDKLLWLDVVSNYFKCYPLPQLRDPRDFTELVFQDDIQLTLF